MAFVLTWTQLKFNGNRWEVRMHSSFTLVFADTHLVPWWSRDGHWFCKKQVENMSKALS